MKDAPWGRVVIREKTSKKSLLGVCDFSYLLLNNNITTNLVAYNTSIMTQFLWTGVLVTSYLGPLEDVIQALARAQSSKNFPGEGSTSKLTWSLAAFSSLQALGLRTSVSSGCHSEVTLGSLPYGSPHWETHNMEACFFKTSKGKCPLARQLLQS